MATYRKKLIEVALPLDAINAASAREKSIRHGHPSTLHLWWARRPLAACRAVLFSSLVNDPGDDPMYKIDPEIEARERANLFNLIEELVLWENSNNPDVINRARLEIARSIAANKVADGELDDKSPLVANAPQLPEEQAKYLPAPPPEYTAYDVSWKMPGLKPEQVNHFLAHYAPPVLDPFAGGGSIPLEAQRLGLRAYASDLNPVPVLINKALIEIPPKFAGMPPVNPDAQKGRLKSKVWRGAEGLAEDVRYYGKWMRDEAEKRIGHLYPKVRVTQEMVDDGRTDLEPYVGQELTVIAWLWARTVQSPNPAVKGKQVPLIRSFWLNKKRNQDCWLEPQVDKATHEIQFRVRNGKPSGSFDPEKGTISRQGGICLSSGAPIPFQHIRDAGKAGEMGSQPLAAAVKAGRKRLFIDAKYLMFPDVDLATYENIPESTLPEKALGFQVQLYGLQRHADLFTERQLALLSTLTTLVTEAGRLAAQASDGSEPSYAGAISSYLAMAVSKTTVAHNTLARWRAGECKSAPAFGRQVIAMVWDYVETNPFAGAGGDFEGIVDGFARVLQRLPTETPGDSRQADAAADAPSVSEPVFSTDPPYYDNIGYADLSDFSYVWLRLSLREIYPTLFATLMTPKSSELIAAPYRFGDNRDKACQFFEEGLGRCFSIFENRQCSAFPATVFYAFKQEETDNEDGAVASTGWETMLEGLISAGLRITGTLPLRTEGGTRLRNFSSNALASSIVLVCRRREPDASTVTRRDFANALRRELPDAIKHLQAGNVAPVDLAQASIGPGMAVFSRYSKVVNADGSPMSVREALQLINQVLDEALAEQESDFDTETRFALKWFEQHGMADGPFGDAETLAKAMAVAVSGVVEAGIAQSRAGKVRLLQRDEMDADWDPTTDSRLTMWEVTQHLIRKLENDGESGAGALLAKVGSANGEIARELAYRLYQTCERKKLADQARSYNALVVSWPEISRLAREAPKAETQTELFE